MNVLLLGDSWGVGVFETVDGVYGPVGQGIHTILESYGHKVTNISKGGGSNWLMIDRLEGNWGNTGRCLFGTDVNDRVDFDLANIDVIVFMQTDIFRERHYYSKQFETDIDTRWKVLEQSFVDSLLDYDSIQSYADTYFDKLYTRLNSYNKKVLCLGGWSRLHPSISNYPNLVAVVESATKLLIPELEQDGYLSDPEWFSQLADNKEFVNKFGAEFKQLTIQNSIKLDYVYRNWNEVHPDISGYELLAKKIQEYLLRHK